MQSSNKRKPKTFTKTPENSRSYDERLGTEAPYAAKKPAKTGAQNGKVLLTASRAEAIALALTTAARHLQTADCWPVIAEQAEYLSARIAANAATRAGAVGRPRKYIAYDILWPDESVQRCTTAAEAAALLHIKPATLSAVLSKGGGRYMRKGVHMGTETYTVVTGIQAAENGEELANKE